MKAKIKLISYGKKFEPFELEAETKEKLFAKIYTVLAKSSCGRIDFGDKVLEKEYYEWLNDWVDSTTELDFYAE